MDYDISQCEIVKFSNFKALKFENLSIESGVIS